MMVDMFPFPRVTGKDSEEQIAELVDYLIQFKEILEFALNNISADNLSPDLVKKINELGANIQKSNEERENEVAQLSSKTLSLQDVVSSDVFLDAIANALVGEVKFNVNFNTGKLEYTITT